MHRANDSHPSMAQKRPHNLEEQLVEEAGTDDLLC